ncbi:MAG: TonB-dependent receptor [Bacteroidia bacterium]|nr:TonB-dependent receptor [Bacteroidia bacterium]MCO5253693.1 TonB-dependent receptor [Bacteroidota bacterium]
MRKIVLFITLLISSTNVFSQIVTVLNAEDKKPQYGVNILCENPSFSTITNVMGQADISLLVNVEKIEFRALGFQSKVMSYAEIEKASFNVSLSPIAINIDGVVVSANRWMQTSEFVPAHISLITPKDIAFFNPQTAADMLGNSGEVFIQKSQQGGGSPMIRGFAANRLLYSVDGVRMNSAIYRSGNLQNVISLDPFAMENAEIFFGPGSVMYGSDAIGGVMSFKTLTPGFSFTQSPLVKGNVVLRTASANNEKTGHIDVNVGWRKWSMLTSISHNEFGDLKMGAYGPQEYLKTYYIVRIDSVDRVFSNPDPKVQIPTAYSQTNVMQKIRFKPNNYWDFQYAFHFSETSEYSRYDKLIEMKNGLPTAAFWNYGPQKWMMNNFTLSHYRNNRFYDEMNVRLAVQNTEESRISRNLTGSKKNLLKTQLDRVETYSANVDFVKSLHRNTFFYGVEYVFNNVISNGSAIDIRNGSAVAYEDRYPQSRWQSYAAYLSYQYLLSKKLTLQAGGRFNNYNINSDFSRLLPFYPFSFNSAKVDKNALTGSLGFVYKASQTWIVSINGSTGFRAPNVDDFGKITDVVSGEVVVPNPNLQAEYVYNGELNVVKSFGSALKLEITGYYTYLDQAMVRRPFLFNGQDSVMYNGVMSEVYGIQNAAYAKIYGAFVGVDVKLPAGFIFSAKYNFQDGTEEMDDGNLSRPRHIAPAYGVSRLTYKYNKLTMQVYTMFSSQVSYKMMDASEISKSYLYAKDKNGNVYSPAWATLNFISMYHFLDNISFTVGIENILDKRYRVYRSGIASAGRNFVFSIKSNF